MVPLESLGSAVSYSHSVVTMTVSLAVSTLHDCDSQPPHDGKGRAHAQHRAAKVSK